MQSATSARRPAVLLWQLMMLRLAGLCVMHNGPSAAAAADCSEQGPYVVDSLYKGVVYCDTFRLDMSQGGPCTTQGLAVVEVLAGAACTGVSIRNTSVSSLTDRSFQPAELTSSIRLDFVSGPVTVIKFFRADGSPILQPNASTSQYYRLCYTAVGPYASQCISAPICAANPYSSCTNIYRFLGQDGCCQAVEQIPGDTPLLPPSASPSPSIVPSPSPVGAGLPAPELRMLGMWTGSCVSRIKDPDSSQAACAGGRIDPRRGPYFVTAQRVALSVEYKQGSSQLSLVWYTRGRVGTKTKTLSTRRTLPVIYHDSFNLCTAFQDDKHIGQLMLHKLPSPMLIAQGVRNPSQQTLLRFQKGQMCPVDMRSVMGQTLDCNGTPGPDEYSYVCTLFSVTTGFIGKY